MPYKSPLCPNCANGCSDHDNNFPRRIWMPLVKYVPKTVDKGDFEGRNGAVEI